MVKKQKLLDDCMPNCKGCSFFLSDPKDVLGECRRYPPVVLYIGDNDFDSSFPLSSADEWCGEFIRRVN